MKLTQRKVNDTKSSIISSIKKDYVQNKALLFMAIPVALYYIIFHYLPMYGTIIAFMDYRVANGIFASKWVGLENFREFFNSFYAWRVIRNTLLISIYSLIFSFPAPIILAILLNEVKNKYFKSTVQTITYLPHFISIIVICGMITDFTMKDGLINDLVEFFGGERKNFLLDPSYFRGIYVVSGIWQGIGWGSILYLAALSGIDLSLYEAAKIDGAGRFRQFLNVTLPGILPTIVVMFILNVGKLMSVGSEKIILLYNEGTYETADVISSFVYRRGVLQADYSYSTAVGLFNSVINAILVVSANKLSSALTESSLW